MSYPIAAIQMTSSHNVQENLKAAGELIQQAAERGARMAVLPEMFAIMGLDQLDKVKYRETLGGGPIQDFLAEQASKYNMWVVGGTIPIATVDDNKVYASCLVFDENGKSVACYNKIHLFDVTLNNKKEVYMESKTTEPGDKVVVIATPFGKIGLAVCYDLRFPEMFRCMHQQGVEIIVLAAAFTYTTGLAHWEILLRARAIENLAYVVAAGQVGTHSSSRKTFGHTMIVNPWGEITRQLPTETGVVMDEINLEYLHQLRQDFPVLHHRRV